MLQQRDAGLIIEAYVYSPYGEHWLVTGPAGAPIVDWDYIQATPDGTSLLTGNRFTYTGRAYDEETGLHYYRTRYYWPETGRFVSLDSIGIWGDPAELGNGYAYVAAGVTLANDPMGEWRIRIVAAFKVGLNLEVGWGDDGLILGGGLAVGWGVMATASRAEQDLLECSVTADVAVGLGVSAGVGKTFETAESEPAEADVGVAVGFGAVVSAGCSSDVGEAASIVSSRMA